MEKVRLRYLRTEEYYEIREVVKVVRLLPLYEIPELVKTLEESKVEEPEVD